MVAPDLLTVAEMALADRAAIASGIPEIDLMENAGRAVADATGRRFAPVPVAVLCGPGNNGGDGFVIARILADRGWPVSLACSVPVDRLKGAAAHHAGLWLGPVAPLDATILQGASLVVDALLGAGLDRPLGGAMAEMLTAASPLPIVAVDVPSGVAGDSGAILGAAPRAVLTVSFFRAKPGHFLMPGRAHCGELVIADIGIPDRVLDQIGPTHRLNQTPLLPSPRQDGHKFDRGHLLIRGGGQMTGAARLTARGARRVGAGLVTVAAPAAVVPIYAQDQPGTIVFAAEDATAFGGLLQDRRYSAVVLGPGGGRSDDLRAAVLAALATGRACLLDADALTIFEHDLEVLVAAASGPLVLTPHEGEFARLFPAVSGDKVTRARAAAKLTAAVVLLKGADTVIADPQGRVVINANAPPELATAGAGDVLAGLIGGLLAQGMAPFEAAAAGTWLHGAAASAFGPGLIAEDLPEQLPAILRRLPGR